MKAIILAAGYATRLRPLTEHSAKPLLPLAGRPMIDYLCHHMDAVAEIDAIHVVTNHRFAADFEAWARRSNHRLPIVVHDDGTRSNDDRLGAIGDIQLTIERGNLGADDLMVVAGDNLFDFALEDYVRFWRQRVPAAAVALYRCPDRELVKQYATVELDGEKRVTSFVEKPREPETDLVATAAYIYHRDYVPLIARYLEDGGNPDQPGRLVSWLYPQVPVYGYQFAGDWLDIGDRAQLLDADNRMRERAGMPRRDEYTLE